MIYYIVGYFLIGYLFSVMMDFFYEREINVGTLLFALLGFITMPLFFYHFIEGYSGQLRNVVLFKLKDKK